MRNSRRAAISIGGFSVLGVGMVMLVTPGPGLLVIIAGLAILATEYAWAQRALSSARRRAETAKDAIVRKRNPPTTR